MQRRKGTFIGIASGVCVCWYVWWPLAGVDRELCATHGDLVHSMVDPNWSREEASQRCHSVATVWGQQPARKSCPWVSKWAPPLPTEGTVQTWTAGCCEHVLPPQSLPNNSCAFAGQLDTTPVDSTTEPTLYLFTVMDDRPDPLRRLAQRNTLQMLSSLKQSTPTLRVGIFVESSEWDFVSELGLELIRLPASSKNQHGTPRLRSLFQAAMASERSSDAWFGFFNSDIVFDRSLLATFHAVQGQIRSGLVRQRVLLVGARSNLEMSPGVDIRAMAPNYEDVWLETWAKAAQPASADTIDFFIMSRSTFDWSRMPDFVVGRVGYDNCLIHTAVSCRDTDVVDVSSTVRAVHQTVGDGNKAGHRDTSDKSWNLDRCPHIYFGTLTDALWATHIIAGATGPDSVGLHLRDSNMCAKWRSSPTLKHGEPGYEDGVHPDAALYGDGGEG